MFDPTEEIDHECPTCKGFGNIYSDGCSILTVPEYKRLSKYEKQYFEYAECQSCWGSGKVDHQTWLEICEDLYYDPDADDC